MIQWVWHRVQVMTPLAWQGLQETRGPLSLPSYLHFLAQAWQLSLPKQLCLGNNGAEEEEQQVLVRTSMAPWQKPYASQAPISRSRGQHCWPSSSFGYDVLPLSCLLTSLGVDVLGKSWGSASPSGEETGQCFWSHSVTPSTLPVGDQVCLWSREVGLEGSYPAEGCFGRG